MKKGLIISSGKINDYTLLEDLINENDYIVCADGGIDHIIKVGRVPNLLLGDLDSISDFGLEYFKSKDIEIKKFPPVKDNTDTELALEFLQDLGVEEITLIGGTGTRLDHTLANIFLLKRFNKNGRVLRIVDDNNIINYVLDEFIVSKADDRYISIIPLGSEGVIVSLEGFEYPLDQRYIEFSSTLGVSNKLKQDMGIIKIHKGEALVFQSLD